jgi:hypothetical protein
MKSNCSLGKKIIRHYWQVRAQSRPVGHTHKYSQPSGQSAVHNRCRNEWTLTNESATCRTKKTNGSGHQIQRSTAPGTPDWAVPQRSRCAFEFSTAKAWEKERPNKVGQCTHQRGERNGRRIQGWSVHGEPEAVQRGNTFYLPLRARTAEIRGTVCLVVFGSCLAIALPKKY